jgi:hypothetical protein
MRTLANLAVLGARTNDEDRARPVACADEDVLGPGRAARTANNRLTLIEASPAQARPRGVTKVMSAQ